MAFIGKFLIVLNTGVSLVMLTWAVLVHTQRINWFTTRTADGQTVVGKIDEMKVQLDNLIVGHERAADRWKKNAAAVAYWEATRPLRQDFYAEQLNLVRTGKLISGQEVNPPVQQLEYQKDTTLRLLDISKVTGRPPIEFSAGQPLMSIATYLGELKSTQEIIDVTTTKITDAIQQHEKVTAEILGDDQSPGLAKKLADLSAIRRGVADEIQYLQADLTNRAVDRLIFTKRLRTMKDRVAELEGIVAGKVGEKTTRR